MLLRAHLSIETAFGFFCFFFIFSSFFVVVFVCVYFGGFRMTVNLVLQRLLTVEYGHHNSVLFSNFNFRCEGVSGSLCKNRNI